MKPILDVPEVLHVIDILCFGHPGKEPYARQKKPLEEILHWGRYDPSREKSDGEIRDWIENRRHKVMYRDESKVD